MTFRQSLKAKIIHIGKQAKKVLPSRHDTWVFTLFFFFCVLTAGLLVWWHCLLNPHPSQELREYFQQEEQAAKQHNEEVRKVIERLKARQERIKAIDQRNTEDRSKVIFSNRDSWEKRKQNSAAAKNLLETSKETKAEATQ